MGTPNTRMFVKPANKDVLVRNPERGRHLELDGEYVERNVYWHRRIQDGDVVEAKAPQKKIASRSTEAQS